MTILKHESCVFNFSAWNWFSNLKKTRMFLNTFIYDCVDPTLKKGLVPRSNISDVDKLVQCTIYFRCRTNFADWFQINQFSVHRFSFEVHHYWVITRKWPQDTFESCGHYKTFLLRKIIIHTEAEVFWLLKFCSLTPLPIHTGAGSAMLIPIWYIQKQ